MCCRVRTLTSGFPSDSPSLTSHSPLGHRRGARHAPALQACPPGTPRGHSAPEASRWERGLLLRVTPGRALDVLTGYRAEPGRTTCWGECAHVSGWPGSQPHPGVLQSEASLADLATVHGCVPGKAEWRYALVPCLPASLGSALWRHTLLLPEAAVSVLTLCLPESTC